jgi:hypothetical protein
MTTIGYARVSTTDQDLDIQVAALKREGCTTIRSEKRSGTSTANREELRTVLDFLRKGDVLMVTRIDRLARSIGDLQDSAGATGTVREVGRPNTVEPPYTHAPNQDPAVTWIAIVPAAPPISPVLRAPAHKLDHKRSAAGRMSSSACPSASRETPLLCSDRLPAAS